MSRSNREREMNDPSGSDVGYGLGAGAVAVVVPHDDPYDKKDEEPTKALSWNPAPKEPRSCRQHACRWLCCGAPARCERRSRWCCLRWFGRVFVWFLLLVGCAGFCVWELRLRRTESTNGGQPVTVVSLRDQPATSEDEEDDTATRAPTPPPTPFEHDASVPASHASTESDSILPLLLGLYLGTRRTRRSLPSPRRRGGRPPFPPRASRASSSSRPKASRTTTARPSSGSTTTVTSGTTTKTTGTRTTAPSWSIASPSKIRTTSTGRSTSTEAWATTASSSFTTRMKTAR